MMSGELMKCKLDYNAVASDMTAEVMFSNFLFGLSYDCVGYASWF